MLKDTVTRIMSVLDLASAQFQPGAFASVVARQKLQTNPFQPCTRATEYAIELAFEEAMLTRTRSITPNHILIGLMASGDCAASRILTKLDIPCDELYGHLHEALRLLSSTDKLRSLCDMPLSPSVLAIVREVPEILAQYRRSLLDSGLLLLMVCKRIEIDDPAIKPLLPGIDRIQECVFRQELTEV